MHRINRVEIELQADDVPLGSELSERVSRMHGGRIAPILDRVCSEMSESKALDRIERLEVDLGSIAAESFEEELVARLEPALRVALSAALRRRVSHGDQSAQAALELLETFGLTGVLPWWADARDEDVVARHFARAAGESREQLVALVRRIAGDPSALDRIARACDVEALLVLTGQERMEEEAPEPIMLTKRRELLSALAFGAADHAVPERTDSREVAPLGARPGAVAGETVAGEMVAGETVAGETVAGETVAGEAASREVAEPGRRLGEQRIAPASSEFPDESRWTEGRRTGPGDGERLLVLQPARFEAAREQLPAETRLPSEVTGSQQAADRADPSDTPPLAARYPSAATRPAAVLHPTSPPPRPETRAPPSRPPVASAAIRAARRAVLARLDELYVDDAGLVILWPFLERFFIRVGLLGEERRFLDEGASIQAVALLEALATGDPEPLELRLPLPKLLCGRPLESDFQLERPLAPEYLAESELLLTAVIARAKVLGELSVPGFRTTFLQHRGALTTRDGAWLLQVERRAHDVLLDRFPWSWSWVKLPWMSDPLQVEW